MLIIFCIALIFSSVGADDYWTLSYDEIKNIIDSLQTSAPDEVLFTLSPGIPYSTELDSSEYYSTPESSGDWSAEDLEDAREWYTTDSFYEVVTDSGPEPDATAKDRDGSPAEHQPHPDEEYEEHQPHPDEEYEEHQYHSTLHVGSASGAQGVHFPDYNDIPLTSFQCSEKSYIPGIYADLETGCQVFHVCWPHRRESFLCPVGTTFNQAILACDRWFTSNCSLAPHYYDVNAESSTVGQQLKKGINVGSMIDSLLEKSYQPTDAEPEASRPVDASCLMKFLPVKAKVVVFPETTRSKAKIVAEASVGKSKKTLKPTVETVTEGIDLYYAPEQEHIPVQPVHKGRDPSVTEGVRSEYMPVHSEQAQAPLKTVHKLKSKPVHKDRGPTFTEGVEAEYMPVYPEPEHVPVKRFRKVVKSKPVLHRGRDPAVDRIIDQIFDIAKSIVKESGHLMPVCKHLTASHKMKPASKFVLRPSTEIEEAKHAHVNPIPVDETESTFHC